MLLVLKATRKVTAPFTQKASVWNDWAVGERDIPNLSQVTEQEPPHNFEFFSLK